MHFTYGQINKLLPMSAIAQWVFLTHCYIVYLIIFAFECGTSQVRPAHRSRDGTASSDISVPFLPVLHLTAGESLRLNFRERKGTQLLFQSYPEVLFTLLRQELHSEPVKVSRGPPCPTATGSPGPLSTLGTLTPLTQEGLQSYLRGFLNMFPFFPNTQEVNQKELRA